MAHLTIAALGPLVVRRDGVTVSGFEYDKVRALLVYLAVEAGRPHPRPALADLLWPNLPERTARGNLSQALSTLRRALGERTATQPFLIADTEYIRFDPLADIALDVAGFLDALSATDAHRHRSWRSCGRCAAVLSQAMGLWRGDFLEGFTVEGAAPFEEWALLQREYLRHRALGALEHLAEHAEWCGRYGDAAAHTRQQVALEPYYEPGHRELMRLLALHGESHAAMAHFETFRRSLASELAAAPEAATETLAESIRSGARDELRRRAAPEFNGPAPPTPLVGRTEDLDALCSQLRVEGVRVVTVTGAGGVGKTRLALEAATDLRFDFEDGVHVIELAAVNDPALVPTALAHTLGVKDHAGEPLATTVRTHLRDKHALLMLDNFEHLLGGPHNGHAAAYVADLLAACPQVKGLITSRAPLRVRAEHLHPLSELGGFEARQLFVTRAQAVRRDFALGGDDEAVVDAICRRLDGLPLAIELVAAGAGTLSPAEMLDDLQKGSLAFGDGPRDVPARHQTLAGAFSWSVERLSPFDERLFTHLSVFALGGSAEAVRAVVGDGLPVAGGASRMSGSASRVDAALEHLAEASLISLQRDDGETRFVMLETIRAFALERLEAQGEADAARRRHWAHFLGLAEQAKAAMKSPEAAAWFDRLEREHDNLRAALARSLEADTETSLRLVAALGEFWEVRGYFEEGIRWTAAALANNPDAPAHLLGQALEEASVLAWRRGDYAGARSFAERCLQIGRDLRDERAVARGLRMLGAVSWDEGDSATAGDYYEQSLLIAREVGDERAIAGALNNLGMVANFEGDYGGAMARYKEALQIFGALGETAAVANTLLNLGLLSEDLGDNTASREYLDSSLATFLKMGHRSGTALVLFNLGNLDLDEGDLDGAENRFGQSLETYKELGDRTDSSYAIFGLGKVLLRRGEFDRARSLMTESLVIRHEAGERRPIPGNLEGLAELERAVGRADLAARLLGAAGALRALSGVALTPEERAATEREAAAVRAAIGEAAFEVARAVGAEMNLDEVVAMVAGPAGVGAEYGWMGGPGR